MIIVQWVQQKQGLSAVRTRGVRGDRQLQVPVIGHRREVRIGGQMPEAVRHPEFDTTAACRPCILEDPDRVGRAQAVVSAHRQRKLQ